MRTQTFIVDHPNGEIQRHQVISNFGWEQLCFQAPGFDPRAIEEIARLYRINIVRKNPALYGTLAFFHLPADRPHPFSHQVGDTTIHWPNVAAAKGLNTLAQEGLISYDGEWRCEDQTVVNFLESLADDSLVEMVQGEANSLCFVPLNRRLGFASTIEAPVVVNTHFFLMDPTDLDSPYCELGTPYGLMLKDGVVAMPPLNRRPCLVVDRSAKAQIKDLHITDLSVEIDGVHYRHGEGVHFYTRPDERCTPPSNGTDLIIVEDRVVATKNGGESVIPMAGFVIATAHPVQVADSQVTYHGLEDFLFGVQVGPPMVKEGKMLDHLAAPFYDGNAQKTAFPPTVYPLPYTDARAARIAIGCDCDGKGLVMWSEGASKCRYVVREDSTGASLLELAQFCNQQGYQEILNLDGGGSAQILVAGMRHLQISDRYDCNSEAERPIPALLTIH